MPFLFTDGFDCYAAPGDAILGYWDSGSTGFTLVAGRFSGSRAIQSSLSNVWLVKNSAQNDVVHHISCAYQQTALTGTTLTTYFQLSDGATNQVCIVFRSDGAILLTSATPAGTVLATYAGAIAATSTWYHFEFEVVINNSTGSFKVRKNGNTTEDHTTTGINTRPGANTQANKLSIGMQAGSGFQLVDDFIWQSSASAGSWIGELRCRTRMPAADSGVQWTPSSPAMPYVPFAFSLNQNNGTSSYYTPFTPPVSGNIGTINITTGTVNAGNTKCSIFSSFGTAPGTPLGSATTLNNMPAGPNTFTFSSPVAVTAGTRYWVGIMSDTNNIVGVWPFSSTIGDAHSSSTVTYAAFPATNPTTLNNARAVIFTINITAGAGSNNAAMVQEAQQDAANSYVYSSTVGQTDRYVISAIDTTPASTFAVTTRALLQKSDAGTRNTSVLLKSGATEVATASAANNTTWGWQYRTDAVDPATGAAWTATAVNNATVGVQVTA